MKERHILALSGGKDSAALAVYMKEKYPHLHMEYVFTDSGCELPETEEYLDRISAFLNIKIIRIGGASKQDRRNFEWWLKIKNYYLPSAQIRWCTEVLKLIPYANWLEKECSDTVVHSYVGIRADEKRERSGFRKCSNKLIQNHPFVCDGLVYEDIQEILERSGIGFPAYYSWRSRSGCYFCFYQTKREWIGLYDHHPDLFLRASKMEKNNPLTGKKYTWCEDVSLTELIERRNEFENKSEEFIHGLDKKPKLKTIINESVWIYNNTTHDIIKMGE